MTKTAKKVVEKVIKPISPSIAKAITKTIDTVEKKVTKVVDGISKTLPTNKGGGSTTKKPEPKKSILIEAKCPEKEKNLWDKFTDCLTSAGKGIVNLGKWAWNGLKSLKDAVWDIMCEIGSLVVKMGKEFPAWVDGILDNATTMAAALPALAGATVLGASIGARICGRKLCAVYRSGSNDCLRSAGSLRLFRL